MWRQEQLFKSMNYKINLLMYQHKI